MTTLLSDLRDYFLAIPTAWRFLTGGSTIAWLVFTVIPKLVPERFKPLKRLFDWAFLALLLIAPFQLWREQRAALAVESDVVSRVTHERDSLNAAIPEIRRLASEGAKSAGARNQWLIRDRIGAFVKECDALLDGGLGVGLDRNKARNWQTRVSKYLLSCGLDRSFEAEFSGAVPHRDQREIDLVSEYMEDNLKAQRRVLIKFLDRLPS